MRSYAVDLRKQLVDVINNSELPIDIKFYILRDVYNEVEKILENFLNTPEEIEQKEQSLEEEQQNEDKKMIPLELHRANGDVETYPIKVATDKEEKSNKDQTN